jgi:hypothetical protein
VSSWIATVLYCIVRCVALRCVATSPLDKKIQYSKCLARSVKRIRRVRVESSQSSRVESSQSASSFLQHRNNNEKCNNNLCFPPPRTDTSTRGREAVSLFWLESTVSLHPQIHYFTVLVRYIYYLHIIHHRCNSDESQACGSTA